VRIVVATNQDLEKKVSSGGFREDLFFRLNVVPLVVPPLRERREDIIPLIQFFQAKFHEKYKIEKQLSPETMEVLVNKYVFK
jgi:transcriptional regulator with GAF, ATPase, and Fis domain